MTYYATISAYFLKKGYLIMLLHFKKIAKIENVQQISDLKKHIAEETNRLLETRATDISPACEEYFKKYMDLTRKGMQLQLEISALELNSPAPTHGCEFQPVEVLKHDASPNISEGRPSSSNLSKLFSSIAPTPVPTPPLAALSRAPSHLISDDLLAENNISASYLSSDEVCSYNAVLENQGAATSIASVVHECMFFTMEDVPVINPSADLPIVNALPAAKNTPSPKKTAEQAFWGSYESTPRASVASSLNNGDFGSFDFTGL